MSGKAIPPGPVGHWLLGNLAEYRRDRLGLFLRAAREHGECVGLRLGSRRVVLLNHPDLITEVLVKQHKNFTKSPLLRQNRRVFGDGLLTAEGAAWFRARKLLQPEFVPVRVATYAPMIVSHASRTADGWRDGETRDLHADMMRLTVQIVSKTLFDADVSEVVNEIAQATTVILQGMISRLNGVLVIPEWVPTPLNLRIRDAVRRLETIVYGIIRERVERREDTDDVLTRLLRARDENGQPLSHKEIRDHVLSLLIAGHETTANALAWCWHLLSRDVRAQAQLNAELDVELGGRDPGSADLPRLRFTEMVVMEALRLFPPAYVIGRQAVSACTIGQYEIPARTIILMSQWVMHRDPVYFERPDEFLPSRWENDLIRRLPDHVFFPFSSGPRICIGNEFAMTEAILILATIAQRFAVRPSQGHSVTLCPSLTLRPGGVSVVLSQRRPPRPTSATS